MKQGICELPYIPIHSEANHRSEMISQLLFGETFNILEKRNSWIKIELHHDNCCGFIEENVLSIISYTTDNHIITQTTKLQKNNEICFEIPMGSKIPLKIDNNNCFSINTNNYRILNFTNMEISDKRKFLLSKAKEMLEVPYLYGGCSEWGVDNSGLSQFLYKLVGINIPRAVEEQTKCGNLVCFLEEAKSGDLAFFCNEEGKIIHVGIIDENKKIIHALGKVRKDNIDYYGIFNVETNKYSHQLSIIKSIL